MFCIVRKEEFQFFYLTKIVLKTKQKVTLYMKEVDLNESQLNSKITSNNSFCLNFLQESVLAHLQMLYLRNNHDAFCQNKEKINEGCMNEFFFTNLQAGTS